MRVTDIVCPDCGSAGAITKVALGRYRCGQCRRTVTAAELASTTDRGP